VEALRTIDLTFISGFFFARQRSCKVGLVLELESTEISV
jgi:hypothetical protein